MTDEKIEDEYRTIERESQGEIKVKASRFIGETFLVSTLDEALEKLQTVRKREHAATHHCYAYRVGLFGNETFKYSDDGEPNGTAGKPIYDVILGRDLNNLLVVVTRYFGGTKLGTGGLVRAYGNAAAMVVDESGQKTNYLTSRFRCIFGFALYDQWLKALNRLDGRVINSDFSDTVTLEVQIRKSKARDLESAFIELTSGKGQIETVDEN